MYRLLEVFFPGLWCEGSIGSLKGFSKGFLLLPCVGQREKEAPQFPGWGLSEY